jgi:hypothetical protein
MGNPDGRRRRRRAVRDIRRAIATLAAVVLEAQGPRPAVVRVSLEIQEARKLARKIEHPANDT